MGSRGPVGKSSDERVRRNHYDTVVVNLNDAGAGEVEIPAAPGNWHPIAIMLYDSLQKSVQARLYDASDWAFAFLTCESISRDLKPQFVGFRESESGGQEAEFATIPLKGASLAAYHRAMTSLLVTIGDRRRAGLEIKKASEQSGPPKPPTDINERRAQRLA